MTLPYSPKKAESIKAKPRIGPAAPANKKRIPSERHRVAKLAGGGCLLVVEVDEEQVVLVVVVEVAAGGEDRPTRLEGTRAGSVWSRTLSTSRL